MIAITAEPKQDSYWEQFSELERDRMNGAAWDLPYRKAGFVRFADLGFPTVRDEDWRFTNIAPIARRSFRPNLAPTPSSVEPDRLREFFFFGLEAHRLVFVDGHYSEALSAILPEPNGVVLAPLSQAGESHRRLIEPHLARAARNEPGAFEALNLAFFQDGAFVSVPERQQLRYPIHLVFVSTSAEEGATAHPRNLILAGEQSSLTILESYVSTIDAAYFNNAATEFVVGEGANVEHCKFQDESTLAFHVGLLQAEIQRSAQFFSHSIVMGGRIFRQNINTRLDGPGIQCVLNGVYLAKNDQLVDHHMVVDHAQPNCESHEYFNGVLDGRARGVFHGRILVRQEAQKTDAKQTNKNLLLSDEATANTKPQLEIYADDVKCTHGATIGELNAESIFYLRARGIPLATAKRMLIHGFAGEIIDRIRQPDVREEADRIVWDRLEQNPHLSEVVHAAPLSAPTFSGESR